MVEKKLSPTISSSFSASKLPFRAFRGNAEALYTYFLKAQEISYAKPGPQMTADLGKLRPSHFWDSWNGVHCVHSAHFGEILSKIWVQEGILMWQHVTCFPRNDQVYDQQRPLSADLLQNLKILKEKRPTSRKTSVVSRCGLEFSANDPSTQSNMIHFHGYLSSWWGARHVKDIRGRSQNLLDAFDIGPRNVTGTLKKNLWPLNFPGKTASFSGERSF